MGQRHSLRPVRPRSCLGPLRNGSLCCISTRMWALPLPRTNPGNRSKYVRRNGPYTLVMNAGGLRSTEVSPLKQIYQKQPVSRQADLVRLVLSIAEFR